MKMKYTTPEMIENIIIELESKILAGSVITEDTTVESVGQEYVELDLNDFNHVWE